MTLSSDLPRGKVIRNVSISEEKMTLPEPLRSMFNGVGRQVDPYLLASAEIQELQKRVGKLLEREQELKEEIVLAEKRSQDEILRIQSEYEIAREKDRERLEEMKEQASARGFDEGYSNGLASAREEAEKALRLQYSERFEGYESQIKGIMERLEDTVQRDIDSSSQVIVRAWRIMLERLLRKKVEFDGESAVRVFKDIVSRVSDWSQVKLFLNPSDRDVFLNYGEEMAEIKRVADIFEIIGDENIEKGSCLLETSLGVFDGRWKSQFEAVDREIESLAREICTDGTVQA